MSDAPTTAGQITTESATPETLARSLRRMGCAPSWRPSCSIRKDKFGGWQVLSPDGHWAWSAQVREWRDAKRDDLGSFGSYEWAATALAACLIPPPGIAEAERQGWALGQRAWLVNRATNLSGVAAGIEDLASDPEGIKLALARPGHPKELEMSPIQTLVANATRVIDACGRIASAARAAFEGLGVAIEGRSVMAGDDVMGVGIPLVDREVSPHSHGGAEGNPQGRTDAPAADDGWNSVNAIPAKVAVLAVTEHELATWTAQLYRAAEDMPRGEIHKSRIRDVAFSIGLARDRMEAARKAGGGA